MDVPLRQENPGTDTISATVYRTSYDRWQCRHTSSPAPPWVKCRPAPWDPSTGPRVEVDDVKRSLGCGQRSSDFDHSRPETVTVGNELLFILS